VKIKQRLQRESLLILLQALPGLSSIPSLWFQVVLVVVWLSFVVLLAEATRRWIHPEPELIRKIVHIGTGNVILIAWWLHIPAWVGITCSVLFSLVTLLSYRFPILPSINSVGRQSLGTFFYAVSIGVLIALYWQTAPYLAVIGILVMTWGDGLAAIIGQRWGKRLYKLGEIQKSWEGSLTMAATAYIVTSLILWGVQGAVWQTWTIPIAIALLATGLEAFSKLGVDNLTVPLGSATLTFLLNQVYFPPG
jgi:phytol kinase